MSTLVLLVGTNPLPNYVVAKYLYNSAEVGLKPDNVLLIHTPETEKVARRLQKSLEEDLKAAIAPLHNFNDPFESGQQSNLKKVLKNQASIHLNYTGGTKAMGVRVYQIVKELENGSNKVFKYSYLDASKHLLRFDDGDSDPKTATGGSYDMRRIVDISLATLKSLHNLEPGKENSKKEFPGPGRWLFDNLVLNSGNGPTISGLRDWTRQFRAGEKLVQPKDLAANPWPDGPGFEDFAERIKVQPGLNFNSSGKFTWEDLPKKEREQLIEYLDGAWLERPVYELLTGGPVKFDPPVTLHQFDLKLKNQASIKKEMQLDTVLLRGYELAVISVTTSKNEGVIKGKAFEALHRAEQLGGEQAFAVVVTLADRDQVNSVRDDLETNFGTDAKIHLKILGLEHLQKLAQGNLEGNFIFET